jgi:mannose-6-phosphate isomerase-like protein (cupin superfamily)
MDRFDMTRRVAAQDAVRAVPDGQGRRFTDVFRHGTLFVEIYAPVDRDPQTPHTRDEAYVVISGSGIFVSDRGREAFGPGDFLFAPAGVAHRFEDFSKDFATWLLFYGRQGGERAAP